MSNSVLPDEATRDIQPITSNEDLSPPATLIAEPESPVLITEQQVMLGTAAAVTPRSTSITRRMMDALRAVGAALQQPAPRRHYARESGYLESARMARAMERL
jgi:hypothetical protein